MKLKFSRLKRLLKRVKDTFNEKAPFYIHSPRTFSSIKVPDGGCVLILPNHETYQKIINGLADAQQWTGINYNETLNDTTLLNN